jgi:nitroreductase
MKKALGDDALNQIFREARTHSAWLDKSVSDEILRQLYDLMKWGPTRIEGCEQEFFPAGHVKSNFLCNLGYGDESKLFPRGPRLTFNEACTLL